MLTVISQFLSNPLRTGAVAPPSEEIARLIVDTADLQSAKTVVELGSGTGVFTERIIGRISDGTLFFAIEINQFFAEKTKKRCPQVQVYNDSAANVKKYLKMHNASGCDCIISGLPWTFFEKKVQEDILDTVVDALNPGGEFLASAYLHGPLFFPSGRRFKKMLHERFSEVNTTRIIWNNLPPGLVYHCRK